MSTPGIHVATGDIELRASLESAVLRAGGRLVSPAEARGLVAAIPPAEVATLLHGAPFLEWVQLGGAGIEAYHDVLDDRYVWTSAKGAYARPVAEHALLLILGVMRRIPERARATSWGVQAGESLYGKRVLVVGGGGIATELVRLLAPFGTSIDVVRRTGDRVPGATRTLTFEQLDDALERADVVALAAALTSETARMLDARRLSLLPSGAVVVNVARGGLVVDAAILDALAAGSLSGYGTDVTDPEPLPDGHAFWTHPRVLLTPHTADTPEMIRVMLAERVAENVAAFAVRRPLSGLVDVRAGY